ncbi:glycerol-3-phosphate 1-O-acyltransferase PlsY [Candidiatus Paracoxiella cheracis]|uniref:glycerol-3-phosphate 1-O-acyltransferase PlsY n=1 Tax=Candidiatus Paracoxiella cheracis TaxID=3405120 RepID=UPI003BF549CA
MGFLFSIIIAYLLGSISTAVIVSKMLKLPDPRKEGSGNPGATNVLRLGGKQAAIYVLIGDALKGLIAVIIGRLLHVDGISLGFVALVAVIGHVFPIFFKFKGGKGVATSLGAILGLSFWVAIFLIATWVIVALIFRYASVAALITAIAAPIYMLIAGHGNYAFPVLLITVLIIWKHWENIDRLRKGTEGKIKF